ncbi:hypothetical protein MBLNU230_g2199t1 [Neophaeotheca triangularis]
MASSTGERLAYTTLVTRASYLAGVIILAHTLRKHGAKHPLVVLYTPSLAPDALRVLELEAPQTNLILRPCPPLLPNSDTPTHLIAERFADTWTKLRVFELFEYDTVCYLDADMTLRNNMDSVFSHRGADLPPDWIAANHACVCNLDSDPWAPKDWKKENCAYTPLEHPTALTKPTEVLPESRPTHHLLNSGMFLFHPSEELWDRMMEYFNTSKELSSFKFPDQDFLAAFFKGKWRSLGWQFNALKTMRYWHENIWRDEEVVCLHYIVDKPWASRVAADGSAGYKGRDGVTHSWWWEDYGEWVDQRKGLGEQGQEVIGIVEKRVASEPGVEGEAEKDEDMRAIGSRVQAFANNKAPAEEGEEKAAGEKKEGEGKQGSGSGKANVLNYSGNPFQNKALGERGHGPMVRPNGSSRMEN